MGKVNLLPWRQTEALRWRRCWGGQLAGGLLLLVCTLLLPAGYFYSETGRWRVIQTQLQQEQQRFQQQFSQHRLRQQRQIEQQAWLDKAQRLQQQHRERINRLLHLATLLPQDLWLRLLRDIRRVEDTNSKVHQANKEHQANTGTNSSGKRSNSASNKKEGNKDNSSQWHIQGLSHNHASIMALMQQLQRQPELLLAQLDRVTVETTASLLRFQITVYWRKVNVTP